MMVGTTKKCSMNYDLRGKEMGLQPAAPFVFNKQGSYVV
jgi:hypothetical protein